MPAPSSRLVISGLAGDVGKSLVTIGIIAALRAEGLRVAPFKKGPDFIDTAWLGAAAGRAGRNLDTFIMPPGQILGSLARREASTDITVVEGSRGLFDGQDESGTHSTAQLAKLIRSPVVLVIDTTKVTRTVAAMVLGCRVLDPELKLAGVILNRVGTRRQERVIRAAIAKETGLPVLGAIPRIAQSILPDRHLGLVTQEEHPRAADAIAVATEQVQQHVDLATLRQLASSAEALENSGALPLPDVTEERSKVRLGVVRDRAFTFYYPENLEALQAAGAELVIISAIEDRELAEIDALYIGGGFPEEHAAALAANEKLRSALRERICDGLPTWAECGGLMYLAQGLRRDNREAQMVGALPVRVEHKLRPQGHGYVRGQVDGSNPFLPLGTELRGHEFHYSKLLMDTAPGPTVFCLRKGVGLGHGRDGLHHHKVVASYTHLHALGTPQWAEGLVAAAREQRP